MTLDLPAMFAGGLLGSAHCLGMCGGFAAAIGAADRPLWPIVGRQVIYSIGRIFTYAFLGAMGGAAGARLAQFQTPLIGVQQAFSILAGLTMVYVGASVLGLIPARLSGGGAGLLAPLFAHFINARTTGGFFIAGVANGFLPCGLVYAFLAHAVSTGSAARGMLGMALFGLGTAPAMVAVGCGTRLLGREARLRLYRVAAVFVLLLGGVTIWRATPAAAAHCGHAAGSAATGPDGDCCHEGPAADADKALQ